MTALRHVGIRPLHSITLLDFKKKIWEELYPDGKIRKWNIANNALYIQSLKKNAIPAEEELLTETQALNEFIMISLRTKEGVDLDKMSALFGSEYSKQTVNACEKYIRSKKMIHSNASLILTNEGKLFADGIAADLFF